MMGTMYDRYRLAADYFEQRDYLRAAELLEGVIAEAGDDVAHGLTDARLLLARSYYHSARLGRAETELRGLMEQDPGDGYATLLLGRTLQRLSRPDEARGLLNRAEAMGSSA